MHQLSLQQLNLRYALIILSLVIAFSLVSFISIKNLFNDNLEKEQLNGLHIKAHNISVRLDFYRKILYQLALQDETKDLVALGDVHEAQLWAQRTQQLIPNSVGVALFNAQGDILGLKGKLRVGKSCKADLHKHIKNISFKKPALHKSNPASAHFDLLKTITINNEKIGVLFTSIKISSLQSLLNRITEQRQHLQLFSGDDKIIVESSFFVHSSDDDKNILHTHRIPIDGTDWYLLAHIQKNDLTDVLIDIIFTNIILFVILSIVLFIFSNQLIKGFSSDLSTIHNLLISLKDNEINCTESHSKFSETENIISDIQNIATDISDSQKQLLEISQHDELSGLLNRRGFFHESHHCVELTKRAVESTLVLLDLDYFKQINDKHGHAAGDKIIQLLATSIKSSTRVIDISARIGGDEFAVILVKCNYHEALIWYQNISEHFQRQQKLVFADEIKTCSLSAGCTAIDPTDEAISSSMSRADKALYRAKGSGRANIKVYKPD